MSDIAQKRVTYTPSDDGATLVVAQGGVNMELDVADVFANTGVRDHLAMLGLSHHLRRVAGEKPAEERLETIEATYDEIVSKGMAAFEPKPRTRKAPLKADKVAALASLEGATITAVEKALAKMSKEEQAQKLNSDRVLEKLEGMRGEDDLDLTA